MSDHRHPSGCARAVIGIVVLVVLAITGLAIIVAVVGESGTSATGPSVTSAYSDNPPEDDVTVTGCVAEPDLGTSTSRFIETKGGVLNHSSKTSNYMISLSIERSGVKVGEANALLSDVRPNQTAEWSAPGVAVVSEGQTAPFTCLVTRVTRYASPPS